MLLFPVGWITRILFYMVAQPIIYPGCKRYKIPPLVLSAEWVNTHSITSVRKKLHWLSINMRINYKILLLVFRAIKFAYDKQTNQITLSSTAAISCMEVNIFWRSHRLLPAAAPSLWNSLPVEFRSLDTIEQFKRALKNDLFSCSY